MALKFMVCRSRLRFESIASSQLAFTCRAAALGSTASEQSDAKKMRAGCKFLLAAPNLDKGGYERFLFVAVDAGLLGVWSRQMKVSVIMGL